MAERIGFQEKLRGILDLAKGQGDALSVEEAEKFFEEEALSGEQMGLVYQYLTEQGVKVQGYTPAGGRIKEPKAERGALSQAEQKYLDAYLTEIERLKETGDHRLAGHLMLVVEEAKKIERSEVYLEDLVQEGNMRLIAMQGGGRDRTQEELLKGVRQAMEALVRSSSQVRQGDRQMVRKVSQLKKAVREMEEEEGRKVTLEEAAVRLGITAKEAEAIWKLTGEGEE